MKSKAQINLEKKNIKSQDSKVKKKKIAKPKTRQKVLKILFVSSEVKPFSQTGGLGDVSGTLPIFLKKIGLDIRVVTPRYYGVDKERYKLKAHSSPLGVPVGFGEKWAGVYEGSLTRGRIKVPVYFLEHDAFFGRDSLYNDSEGKAYQDNLERFTFLSRGALQLAKKLKFIPDLIHVNDWQTALIPIYLNTWESASPLSESASLLTIHNLFHQGTFPKDDIMHTQLSWEYCLEEKDHLNILKGGICHATKINAVSPTYAEEIKYPTGGNGQDGVLRERSRDLTGILNGIDYSLWDPMKDKMIPVKYNNKGMKGKKRNKAFLQKRMGLEVNSKIPLLAIVSRLDRQKGIDILAEAIHRIMELKIQFVLLGVGETWANFYFGDLPKKFPGRAGVYIGFDEELSHLIEAGADLFLMPSRFEPCGLNQMYSQRYGTLPIVRGVGGLRDSVINFSESRSPKNEKGTGFIFRDLNASSLYDTIGWAVYTYYNKEKHFKKMIQNAMKMDFSWEKAAIKYLKLYKEAIQAKKRAGK